MTAQKIRRRARRQAIDIPLVFRLTPENGWQTGRTVNLSRTGVLFKTGGPAPNPRQVIEFIVSLPLLGPEADNPIQCTGRVTRLVPGNEAEGGLVVGVAIETFELLGPPTRLGGATGGTKVPLH
jgi:hypothetical protein